MDILSEFQKKGNRVIMERMELATAIAKEAGDLTLTSFNNLDFDVEYKKDGTPVTLSDRNAERLLRERITDAFPDDAILGEEFGAKEGTSGFRWILDPIDGTKSFIHGVPLYSTLVGIEKEGEPVMGVIWIPALNEGTWAEKGSGAWWFHPKFKEVRRARVSETNNLDKALFLTSEVDVFNYTGRRDAYNEIEKKCYLTRTWGDAFGYYLVATGRADLMIDADLGDWDAGPLMTILEEAGGHFTDWKGKRTIFGAEGVGINDALYNEVIEITQRFPKVN